MVVRLPEYFEFLNRQGLIQPHHLQVNVPQRLGGTARQFVPSIKLVIPAIWQALLMPGEEGMPRVRDMVDALPSTLRTRLTKMGFRALENPGRLGAAGERTYVLQAHTFPITAHFYQHNVINRIRDRLNGVRIPKNQQFEQALQRIPFDRQMAFYEQAEVFHSAQDAVNFLNNL